MNSDKYVLTHDNQTDGISDVQEKFTIKLPDANAGNYTSNQIQFRNMTSLTNYASPLNLRESYIEIPMQTLVSGTGFGDKPANVKGIVLKGFLNMIDSYEITVDSVPVVQHSRLSHIVNGFKYFTTTSESSHAINESVLNICKDDAISYSDETGEENIYSSGVTRRSAFNNVQANMFRSNNNLAAKYQSYSERIDADNVLFHHMVRVPLDRLSAFFDNCTLQRGVFLNMDININVAQTTINLDASGNIIGQSVNSTSYGYVPHMITSDFTTTGLTSNITIKTSVINVNNNAPKYGTSCNFCAMFYKLSPEIASSYFSKNIRTINYEKFLMHTFKEIQPGQYFNGMVSPSANKMRYMLIIPLLSEKYNGGGTDIYTTSANAVAPLLSSFTNAGQTTAPAASFTNFNVLINNLPFYKKPQSYGWEMYRNEIMRTNSLYGNNKHEIGSGLISYFNYVTGHSYVYVDLRRKQEVFDDSISAPVHVEFTNNSLIAIDAYCWICQEMSINVDITTGKIVT